MKQVTKIFIKKHNRAAYLAEQVQKISIWDTSSLGYLADQRVYEILHTTKKKLVSLLQSSQNQSCGQADCCDVPFLKLIPRIASHWFLTVIDAKSGQGWYLICQLNPTQCNLIQPSFRVDVLHHILCTQGPWTRQSWAFFCSPHFRSISCHYLVAFTLQKVLKSCGRFYGTINYCN